jgi:hypothetical protein
MTKPPDGVAATEAATTPTPNAALSLRCQSAASCQVLATGSRRLLGHAEYADGDDAGVYHERLRA